MRSSFTGILRAIGALAIVVVSFWITLKVLREWDAEDPTAPFVKMDVQTQATFERTAPSAGFTKSSTIVGYIDVARRQPTGVIEVAGWAVDRNATGNPVYLYIIVNGRPILRAAAKGPRNDVAGSLKLAPDLAANVAVAGTSTIKISCDLEKSAMAVVLNQNKQYSIINGNLPISGCD